MSGFGGHLPDASDPDLLAWLDDFTKRHWDFRAGGERDQLAEPAPAPRPEPEPDVEMLVRSAVTPLGLDHGAPPRSGRYDQLVVRGGLAGSCLARVRAAESLIRDGGVDVGEIVLLGSHRSAVVAGEDLPGRWVRHRPVVLRAVDEPHPPRRHGGHADISALADRA